MDCRRRQSSKVHQTAGAFRVKSNCECAQEFLDRDAEDVIAEKSLGPAIEQYAPRFGIVRRKCLESGKILGGEPCRVFHFDGVESVFAIDYEIDFLPRVRPPETQCIACRAVVYPCSQLLKDKTLKRGSVDFCGQIERPLRADGAKYAGVEEIELVVSDESALCPPRERRQSRRHQQIYENRKVGVHHRPAHAAVAGNVRGGVERAVGEGYRFEEAGECRKIPDETFVLDFFADIDGHVGGERLPPVIGGDYERNHAAHKGVFEFEVPAHFRREERMAIVDDGASGQEIHAASLQFAGAGAGQYVSTGAAVAFDEPMHDGQKRAYALHFVNDDGAGVRVGVDHLGEPFGLGFKPRLDVLAQQIDVQGIGERVVEPCGLAGSSWPEKEETPFAKIDESLVLHGAYCIKYS